MKRNIGGLEMILRLFAGILLADLSVDQALNGHWNIITPAIATVLLVTALTRFCPIHALFSHHQKPHHHGSK
jgi:hypothetical protein